MNNALRIYAWFLLIITALPAIARVARPRELARIVLKRYENPKRRKRAFAGGSFYLALSAFAIAFIVRQRMRHERWLLMAVLVGMVSAFEFVVNSRARNEEALARQNRMFGGAYAALAIATILLIFTR